MKTVLIVEDESELRTLLAHHLQARGYTVIEAENGRAGLQMALDRQPDLILLDLQLPGMPGFQVLSKLRTESGWGSTVPVIILTNMEMRTEEERHDIELLKPSHYIIKANADPSDVFQKVQQLIS